MSKRPSEKELQLENEELKRKLRKIEEKDAKKKNLTSQNADTKTKRGEKIEVQVHDPPRRGTEEQGADNSSSTFYLKKVHV